MNMSKGFLVSVLTAITLMFAWNVSAQQKATGDARKDLLKHEKVLDKDLKKKALKKPAKKPNA